MKRHLTLILTSLLTLCSGTACGAEKNPKSIVQQHLHDLFAPFSAVSLCASIALDSYRAAKLAKKKTSAAADREAKLAVAVPLPEGFQVHAFLPETALLPAEHPAQEKDEKHYGALLALPEDLWETVATFMPQKYQEECELKRKLSVDDKVLALAQNVIAFTDKNNVIIWNTKTGVFKALTGHAAQITALLKLNDTTIVSMDATMLIAWDLRSYEGLRTITGSFFSILGENTEYQTSVSHKIIALPINKIAVGNTSNNGGVTIFDMLGDSEPIKCDTGIGEYENPETARLLDSAVHFLVPLSHNRLAVQTTQGSIKRRRPPVPEGH